MPPTESPVLKEESSPTPLTAGGRGWLDATVRLATSWVGLFAAYAAAVTLALSNIEKLRAGFTELHLPLWGGMALIAALPLFALVFSTIPSVIEQRRIRRSGEIKVDVRANSYFTLRPRDTEEGFDRVDNAHREVLRWIENTKEPVLYLTGASGTGKSSLLAAWVIPKLTRDGHVVITLRGYEQILERIKDRILEPGVIWMQPPDRDTDLRLLLERACQRLDERRLILVIDQFEEFLILKDEEQQRAFQQFLSAKAIAGVTFLLVFRPEYEGLIQDQDWPTLKLDRNRKVISAFTENAATEFLRKSGLTLNTELTRTVMREAGEIEQGTVGLIRPVTLNLCGLVLSRFSSGLPRKFRGGILRGFLREALLLTEVRDVAEKVLPSLITGNVTKRPRTIGEMAQTTGLLPAAVRACMQRLGESDRAIVRPLDERQETWEISHDFLVPLLDALIARRTISLWRRARPWLPWTAAGIVGVVALVVPWLTKPDITVELRKQGWIISETTKEGLVFSRKTAIPSESIAILRSLPSPYGLNFSNDVFNRSGITDISALRELRGMTSLNLNHTQISDISALKDLKGLQELNLNDTRVSDLSALQELKALRSLNLNHAQISDISALKDLKGLQELNLNDTQISDISALKDLKGLQELDLNDTQVSDISALRNLKGLKALDLGQTKVSDISTLRELKVLTTLNLISTRVSDISALRNLKDLKDLDFARTKVSDISVLRELKALTTLNFMITQVSDISALKDLKGLKMLYLNATQVSDISALRELKSLTTLELMETNVADISALRGLRSLESLSLSSTKIVDVSALQDMKSLTILDLSFTKVFDISVLRDMKGLTTLSLSGTKVTDVSALQDLIGLRELYLSATSVTDVSELQRPGLRIIKY